MIPATRLTTCRVGRRQHTTAFLALALSLAGCGGGGGGNGSNWTPGVFLDASTFQNQCVAPRSGTNPATGDPYLDVAGTRTDENNFLRSYSNDTYLWYDEIVDRDPGLHETLEYFDLLKTNATTASGAPKDKFHFTYPSDEWFQLSQSGTSAGYGAQWVLLQASPSPKLLVAYVDPNTPASDAGLARGDEVLAVDGVDSSDIDTLINYLFPAADDESHDFEIRDPNGTVRNVTLVSAIVTSVPVQNVRTVATGSGVVGYLLFNDHIRTAEQGLIDAVDELASKNITDLVIDVRYNGGGFLYIASQFAYMIAGSNATAGRTFENLRFNDKHPSTDPVTGDPLQPMPFFNTRSSGQALPTLDLPRVFVLTGPGTCSASESIINGLRGIDVDVVQIGSTTCGKPYGFYPTGNCGTTYFTIQFRGENDKGFGDYADGFSPENTGGPLTTPIPGCSVADDFSHPLGDPDEGRFAAALGYIAGMDCPAPTGVALPGVSKPGSASYSDEDMVLPRSPLREMRILDR